MDSVPSYLEPSNQGPSSYNVPPSGAVRRIDFGGVSEDETIRVFLRVKPISTENINDEINTKHYKLKGDSFTSVVSTGKAEIYNEYFFNAVLTPTTTQTDVFDVIVRPRLEEVLEGSDTLLFAYGTTGSGKSYTIQGKGSEPGIIPRVLYVVFASIGDNQDSFRNLCPSKSAGVTIISKQSFKKLQKIKEGLLKCANQIMLQFASTSDGNDTIRATSCSEMKETLHDVKPVNLEKEGCEYSVWISFIEIYNENIYDLFVKPESKIALQMAMDEKKKTYLKGVTYMCVSSWEEAYQLYLFGKHNLHVSSTCQNKNSSRSHSSLTIKIIKRPKESEDSYFYVSSFTICDLAGAERQKKSRTCGARLKESQNINTSLLVLNRCFNIIRSNQRRRGQDYQMVPFRESKLTLLFQHALLGNAGISMITNISQSDELTSETHQVLKSTAVAMKIKAKPFIKKTFAKRKSIFSDYCSTRIEVAHPQISSDIDEGVGSSLSCSNCLEYKKEIKMLQKTLEQKDITLYEEKEKCNKREEELRIELVNKFSKILDDSDKSHSERIDRMKKSHREQVEEAKAMMKEYYEEKIKNRSAESCLEGSFMQIKKSMEIPQNQELANIKAKVLKLGELFEIEYFPDRSDVNVLSIIDRIIDIKTNTSFSAWEKQTEEMGRIQGELTQLQKKVLNIAEVCGIHCTSDVSNVMNEINILDEISKTHMKMATQIMEQEKILARGVTDYTELESVVRQLELKKNQLEEDLVLKDLKIEEMQGDINNLDALLKDKTKSEPLQVETDAATAALDKLTLDDDSKESTESESKQNIQAKISAVVTLGKLCKEDGAELPLECDKPISAVRRHTRRQTRLQKLSERNSDTDNDDPTFFLPVQAATTGKKKKKRTRCVKQEIPSSSYSNQIAEGDVTLDRTRTRRKLFRKESDHFGGEEQTVQIHGPDLCQQSPESFMRSLRSSKK